MIDDFIYIGQVRRTHGVKGLIRLFIDEPFEPDFNSSNFIYIDINGDFVPYFFESKEGSESFYLVKFDDVHTPEDGKLLASFGVYLNVVQLSPATIDYVQSALDSPNDKYVGYSIAVENNNELIKINEVIEYPHQWMASVSFQGRDVLIPIVDAFIIEDDTEHKILKMQLPEGLL